MSDKVCEGFGGFGSRAPVPAGDYEETGGVNEVVAEADDGGCGRCVVASGSEADAVVKLGEELVDGRWRMPRGGHAKSVGIEFSLGDGAPGGPEVSEDLEARDAAEAEFGVGELTEVVGRDGEKNLVAEGLVGFLVGSKGELIFVEGAVDLGDLGSSGVGRMERIDGAVDGSNEGNVAGEEEVGSR